MKIFVSSDYGYWGGDIFDPKTQLGGGETAMVNVSKELARLGHDVTVFYNVQRPGLYDGVNYLPKDLLIPLICQMEHDVLVAWDSMNTFRYADRAKVRTAAFQLNDAFIGVYDWTVDLYFHPSQWHADMFKTNYPEIAKDKQRTAFTNGINVDRFVNLSHPRQAHQVIYSSSPDRGLHHLLKMWPKIREKVSDATLEVYYDYKKWIDQDAELVSKGLTTVTTDRAKFLRDYLANGPAEGITFHGGVGKSVLAEAQVSSALLAYPCDPVRPTEGFSMTILEALTAGCKVVISDADALPELWASAPGVVVLPLPVEEDVWVDTIVSQLLDEDEQDLKVNLRYSWARIAKKWETEFTCLLKKL